MNNTSASSNDRLDLLLQELKTLDSKNLIQVRRWRVIMATIAVMYTILLMVHPTFLLLVDAICLYGFFIIYHYSARQMSRKDFSLPVIELLKNTRKRYSLFQPVTFISAVLAIPLIYGGIEVLITRYFQITVPGLGSTGSVVLVFIVFYLLVLVAAYLAWKQRYDSIRKEIDMSLKDLLGT